MLDRIFALAVAFVLAASLAPPPAQALDLAAARSGGAVLAEALKLGQARDWAAAERVAARSGDPLIPDLVLWQKLRAGAGSMAELQVFAGRRAGWPGLEALARAMSGTTIGRGSGGLTGAAAANWQQFGQLWSAKRYDEAAQLLGQITGDRHKLGVPEIWASRREALARRMARLGRGALGYELARQHHLSPADASDYAELEWLAGWIALRKLGEPRQAVTHFERFNQVVETPISLGRGGYWLGRAHEALGEAARAAEWYRAGARHQTAFYGQLAAAKHGVAGDADIAAAALPDWSKSPALRSDDVRAGVLLLYAGEEALAFWMFSELGKQMDGGAALGALAGLGLELGRPHFAVRIAKHAARKGLILYPAYYPVTELAGYASKVEPALAMAIARQETELNPRAISPAGARGLMQLMPGTAKKVAGQIGEAYSDDRLIEDWQYNARLGQSYLAEQIGRFGGSYMLAAAAYNAGPHRVDQWIGEFGDPRLPGVDLIDWMESIPFSETRNYVQRVMEGLYVYRTRLAGHAGPMSIAEDLMRGVRGGCPAGGTQVLAALAGASGTC
ncbi:MAG TPA: lytic transglycosylase domain-containing protein [Thermohalobaculum sp.]|nr:lytic transglycosylase domain-containing protein [Thermohalobaculum sp.]